MIRSTGLLVIMLLSLLPPRACADVLAEWVARYDGPAHAGDAAYAIAVDDDGSVYVTGRSGGVGTGEDFATVKYGPGGCGEWVARYDGPASRADNGKAVAVDDSGNVYVTGFSFATTDNFDYVTIKYSADGDERWVARYDGPAGRDDNPTAMALDADGNVYVTGYSCSYGSNLDYATVKYDTNGNEEWVAGYDGPIHFGDIAWDIALDGDGYVYVTGTSEGDWTSSDFATVKYDPDGNEEWVERYNSGSDYSDHSYAIALDEDANVYVAGERWTPGNWDDYTTLKYDRDGRKKWMRGYNGPADDDDMAVAVTTDCAGHPCVTGLSYGVGSDLDYATVKYHPDGHEEWTARYNGPGNEADLVCCIVADGDGNVYVTGRSLGSGTSYDYATVSYDADGNESWVARYDGPPGWADMAHAIAVDGEGRVYVTGGSESEGTGYDYATIMYSTVTGLGSDEPLPAALHPARPNPFSDRTTVGFTAEQGGGNVRLAVYNVRGELVRTLIDGSVGLGRHTIHWDGMDSGGLPVSSGVYLVRLEAGGNVSAVKAVVLR